METLKINVNSEKVIELHFGSWVMGQLAKQGWGYDLAGVLTKIASNPFESMALLLHLGLCSAQKKSLSLNELSLDDAYDTLDEIGKYSEDEAMKIRDSFLISAFGEKVLDALKNLNEDEIEESESDSKKKVVAMKSK